MGVRCFWPHNMIGHEGLVVDQASKLRSLPTNHQVSPRIQDDLRFSAEARRSCGGQIILLTGEHGPGDPCRLIGERDNRPIKAAPRCELLQPLGTAILVLRQSKHDSAGAINHLDVGDSDWRAGLFRRAEVCLQSYTGAAQGQSTPQVPALSGNDVRRRRRRRAPSRLPDRRPAASSAADKLRSSGRGSKFLIQLVEPAVEGLKLVEQVAEETPREIGKIGGRDGVLRLF